VNSTTQPRPQVSGGQRDHWAILGLLGLVLALIWPVTEACGQDAAEAPESTASESRSGFVGWLQDGGTEADESGAMEFFKEHFFGYEPFYFLAGTESPNAKFQISLRYRILNHEGPLAQKVPWLEGFNLAYTQRSLWDLEGESAPFLDSSYMPEFLYRWERVDRGRWASWLRLDLQGGLQHESNGKGGADSRSLNVAYLRPTITLGQPAGFRGTLAPGVWAYVGSLDDNPDLRDYRGYADLRANVGWARGLQLGAWGRLGSDGNHGSVQLDLTYPMMRLLSGSFSLYLQAQYFTGYGESLLLYNQRSEAFRAGFALYR
jgi:phospholipase A1/A2